MGRGGQHAPALDVLGLLDLLRRFAAAAGRAGRLDLRQTGEVSVAQHQADVGMGNKTALRIDEIGLPARAHLDLGYHVPDKLEIDLRDAHACVATRPGQRQRHVGLRLPAKIDGSVVNFVRNGFRELRVLGEVGLARHHVHGKARDAQLLVAGRIELRELGDRRHLPQQPQSIEPPLVDGAGGPRQLRGPPHLALDLFDELADLGRRGLGLLALDADQGCLVLLKGEDDF
jgi:hypothetical protein